MKTDCRLKSLLAYFLYLGTFGFGGPVALAGYMQVDLVEKRKWITQEEYAEGLALSQLTPGPMATQLAIYLGWVCHGFLGATLVAIIFVLPSFLIVLGISELYIHYNGLPWMQGIFYGVGAAVIAIIVKSAIKLIECTIEKDNVLWIIFIVSAIYTIWIRVGILWLLLVAGAVNYFWHYPPGRSKQVSVLAFLPSSLVTGLYGPASGTVLWQMFFFFASSGALVFGSGLGIIPFLYDSVVHHYHWLTRHQFIDAVSVALVTPGPGIITVAFIGYLVAGFLGALVSSLAVFLPCYLIVVLLAPHYRRIMKNEKIKVSVRGIVAAAIGTITGSAFILGRRAIFDIPTALIATCSLLVLRLFPKIPDPVVLLVSALIGLAVKGHWI